MKKIFLFCAVITSASFFTACEEECEKNNTGDITIQNNTEKALYFDVTKADGVTNQNRYISSGSSTTYTMPAGPVKVWGSHTNINADFKLLRETNLSQCAKDVYATVFQSCELFNTTQVKVVNNTGYGYYVDVYVSNYGWLGEQYLGNGSTITYSDVPANTATFWIEIGGSWYSSSSSYNLTVCQLFTFTWTAKKLGEAEMKDKNLISVEIEE